MVSSQAEAINRAFKMVLKFTFRCLCFVAIYLQITVGELYTSYQAKVKCNSDAPITYPKTVQELQDLVREAGKSGKTIKGIGNLHSATDIICTEGIPVSLKLLNFAIYDDESGKATFGAAVTLQEALEFLESKNRSLFGIPYFSKFTMGGMLGSGTHGSSLLHPSTFSDQVLAVTLIDGQGELKHITSDDGDMKIMKVNLGLVGIIVDVSLKTVPLYKMKISNTIHSEDILWDPDATVLKWAHDSDYMQMWWFPATKQVIVARGIFLPVDVEGNAVCTFNPDVEVNPYIATVASETYERLQASESTAVLRYLEYFAKLSLVAPIPGRTPVYGEGEGPSILSFRNPATGFGWRLQSNACNKCVWDNELMKPFLVDESAVSMDLEQFGDVTHTIRNFIREYPAGFSLSGIFIRFLKGSDSLMSISNGKDSFLMEWVTPTRRNPYEDPMTNLATYQWLVQKLVQDYGGRTHWAKSGFHYLNTDLLQKRLNRDEFIKAMSKYDPKGVFLNKFGRRLLEISKDFDMDLKVHRCALQDYCVCQKDSDCAAYQRCSVLKGFNVCMGNAGISYLTQIFGDRNSTQT